jgi:hypothetical protein
MLIVETLHSAKHYGNMFFLEVSPARLTRHNTARWWVELHSRSEDGTCTHWYTYDTGAYTLHRAIKKGYAAAEKAEAVTWFDEWARTTEMHIEDNGLIRFYKLQQDGSWKPE